MLSLLVVLAISIRAADQPPRAVVTIAGQPGVAGLHDGLAETATFNHPTWLDVVTSTGDIFVIDRLNNVVRNVSGGIVSTVVVHRDIYDTHSELIRFNFDGPFGGGIVLETPASGCGGGPWGPGMYVASSGSQEIFLVAPLSTMTSLGARDEGSRILGLANTPGSADGPPSVARFNTPIGIARSWNYSREETMRQALFVADTSNHTIRKIWFTFGAEACPIHSYITTLAGAAGQRGSADGVGAAARFDSPHGVASAPNGDLYVTDTGNHTVRRISPDGTVATVAGEAGVPGMNDGPARQAHLNAPSGIDVDSNGAVFIADTGNHAIRELTPDGQLITIAGTPGVAGFADGDAAHAQFNGPVGLKVLKVGLSGALIVADTSNHVLRRILLTGNTSPSRHRTVRH